MADLKLLTLTTDNLVSLEGLTDQSSGGGFVNTATVTARVLDKAGVVLASGISLPFVSGSNGNYEGTIQDTVLAVQGEMVTIEVTAIAGASKLIVTRRAFVDN